VLRACSKCAEHVSVLTESVDSGAAQNTDVEKMQPVTRSQAVN